MTCTLICINRIHIYLSKGSQNNINTLYSSVILVNKTRAKGTVHQISKNAPFKGYLGFSVEIMVRVITRNNA